MYLSEELNSFSAGAEEDEKIAGRERERKEKAKGKWLRIAGKLVRDDRVEAKRHMLDAYPSLKAMYSAEDDNTEVLYFEEAVATFSSFTEAPRTVRF